MNSLEDVKNTIKYKLEDTVVETRFLLRDTKSFVIRLKNDVIINPTSYVPIAMMLSFITAESAFITKAVSNGRTDGRNSQTLSAIIKKAEALNNSDSISINGVDIKISQPSVSYVSENATELDYDKPETENGITRTIVTLRIPPAIRKTLEPKSFTFSDRFSSQPNAVSFYVEYQIEKYPDLLKLDPKGGEVVPSEKLEAIFKVLHERFEKASSNSKAFQTASAAK